MAMVQMFPLKRFGTEPKVSHREANFEIFRLQQSLPMPLFKATNAIYVDRFFKTGELRLGTIWDFRRAELGPMIGDDSEGIRAHRFNFNNVPHIVSAIVKDSFVFCVSHDLDVDRFKSEGHNAVYRIDDLCFFQEINRCLHETTPIYGYTVHQVMYADDDDEVDYIKARLAAGYDRTKVMPPVGLLKPKSYALQNEVRAIFEPIEAANKSLFKKFDGGASVAGIIEQKDLKSQLLPKIILVPEARQHATRLS